MRGKSWSCVFSTVLSGRNESLKTYNVQSFIRMPFGTVTKKAFPRRGHKCCADPIRSVARGPRARCALVHRWKMWRGRFALESTP